MVNSSGPKQKPKEEQERHWKRNCEIEKDCNFRTTTPVELKVSKLVTSTNETEVRNKTGEKITVKLVKDKIWHQKRDKTQGKKYIPNKEIKQKRNGKVKVERTKKTIPTIPCKFCKRQIWTPEHKCQEKEGNRNNFGKTSLHKSMQDQTKQARQHRKNGRRIWIDQTNTTESSRQKTEDYIIHPNKNRNERLKKQNLWKSRVTDQNSTEKPHKKT